MPNILVSYTMCCEGKFLRLYLHNRTGDHVAKGVCRLWRGPPYHRRRVRKLQESFEGQRKRKLIERARKGGLGLLAKRGREHFVQMGKLGGRPTWQKSLEKAKASLRQINKRNDTV